MEFARIRSLLQLTPEDYARQIWNDALKRSGSRAYRRFLSANPLEAGAHLAHLSTGFEVWSARTQGMVYVCTHPAFPGKVKIGCTLKEELEPRVRGLRSAGVIGRHTAIGFVRHFNARGLEAALHREFRPMKVEREWFSTPADLALTYLYRNAAAEIGLRAELTAPINHCTEFTVQ